MKNLPEYSQKSPRRTNRYSLINSKLEEVERKKTKVLSRFMEKSASLFSGDLTFYYGGRPVRGTSSDIVRMTSELSQNDLESLAIRNIILNTLMSLETTSTFSGACFARYLLGQRAFSYRTRATQEEVDILLKKNLGSGICFNIVKKIVCNPGLASKLDFRLSHTKQNFIVEQKNSYSLLGCVPIGFDAKKSLGRLDNARILYIEGNIETVSEIHHLLDTSSKEEDSVLLIAQSFSPDVVSTLHENYMSEKLNVIPFVQEKKESFLDFFRSNKVMTISQENGEILNSVSFDDMTESFSLIICEEKVDILGIGKNDFENHFTILVPPHFHKLAGLIEDRVRSGIKFHYEISKYGIALDKNKKPVFGLKQYRDAKKHVSNFRKTFKDIGCLIVLE